MHLKFLNFQLLMNMKQTFIFFFSFSLSNIPQVKKHKSLPTSKSSCHVVVDGQDLWHLMNTYVTKVRPSPRGADCVFLTTTWNVIADLSTSLRGTWKRVTGKGNTVSNTQVRHEVVKKVWISQEYWIAYYSVSTNEVDWNKIMCPLKIISALIAPFARILKI